jgi:hypothetical protein
LARFVEIKRFQDGTLLAAFLGFEINPKRSCNEESFSFARRTCLGRAGVARARGAKSAIRITRCQDAVPFFVENRFSGVEITGSPEV